MSSKNRSTFLRGAALPVALLLAGAFAAVAFVLSPLIGLDFQVYLAGGASVLEDAGELYTKQFQYGPESSLLFTYPPFAALLFAVLAPLGHDAGMTIITGLGIAVAVATAVWAAGYVSRRAKLRDIARDPWLRAAAVAGSGFIILLGPWRETLAFGQVNIVLFGLIMADFLVKGRGWPTGFLTGLAAGVKLTPLVFGLYFLVRRDWRGLRNMSLGFLTAFGVGFLLLPGQSRTYWLELLPDTSRIGGPGFVDNLSIKGAILHFGGPGFPVDLPWLLLSLLATAAAAVVIRGAANRADTMTALAATALLMLLISPVSWSHHWTWVALFLPVLARNLLDLGAEKHRMKITGTVLLGAAVVIFLFSPKTIGRLLNSPDLDSQLPGPWLMASSAGVIWAAGMLAWWCALVWRDYRGDRRRGGVTSRTEQAPRS